MTNIFAYVKERVAIADVVREYVALRPLGTYLKGHCPFHSERTASFTVSPHRGIFYCFGCHATGDVVSFVEQIEHCSPFQAAQLLAERFDITLPKELLERHKKESISGDAKKRYFDLCAHVAAWCSLQLSKAPAVQEYIQSRALAAQTVARFKLGYFPAGQQEIKSLCAWVQKGGFLARDLVEVHILVEGQRELYSPFEGRLMFPIADHLGRMCGFGGRVVKAGDDRVKYYNSKENAYFAKGSLLFGLEQAKKAMQEAGHVFLVEGYTDCLAMAQHGYPQTVATLGTACTPEHLKIIGRYVDDVYVLYDGDQAGINAMLRLTELCWNANLDMRVVSLPEGQDPASFLGAEQSLKEFVDQARDIFSFFIDQSSQSFGQLTLKKKTEAARAVTRVIANVGDPLKKEFLLQQASHALAVPLPTLRASCRTANMASSVARPSFESRGATGCSLEQKLFCIALERPALLARFEIAQVIDMLDEPLARVLALRQQHVQQALDAFIAELTESDRQLTHALLLTHDKIEGDEEVIVREVAKRYWKRIVQRTKEQVSTTTDEKRVAVLLAQLQDVKKKLLDGSF